MLAADKIWLVLSPNQRGLALMPWEILMLAVGIALIVTMMCSAQRGPF